MRTVKEKFDKRKQRVRMKLSKVSNRFRLSIFKSNMHLHAQIIDVNNSNTLVSASTLEKDIRVENKSNSNKAAAERLAKVMNARAINKGIVKVVFDKAGYKYHGVIKTFADAMRNEIEF